MNPHTIQILSRYNEYSEFIDISNQNIDGTVNLFIYKKLKKLICSNNN